MEPIPHVFRWDGTAWHGMGWILHGPGAYVLAMRVHQDQLVASGFNIPVEPWDGAAWVQLGSGSPTFAPSLSAFRGELMVGTDSSFPTGIAVSTWNGFRWSALPAGPLLSAWALRAHGGALYAGGYPAPYWARWGCPCYADCDNSGGLSVADFACFQTQFVLGHPYADCNDNGALTVANFGCFQTRFVAGCP